MGNLIYILLVLVSIGIFASSNSGLSELFITRNIDSAKLNLNNETANNYQAVLSGAESYIFNLQPSGKQMVNVKAGRYDIKIYPTSNDTASAATEQPVDPKAQFNGVVINSADLLKLSITNAFKLNNAFKVTELGYSRN